MMLAYAELIDWAVASTTFVTPEEQQSLRTSQSSLNVPG